MNLVAVPVAVVAGITLYVGGYHLWLHLRRPNKSDLYFAITCALMALYDIASVGLYDSSTVAEGSGWQRLQFAAMSGMGVSFVLFVNAFVKYSPPRFLPWLLVIYPVVGIVGLFERSGLLLVATRHVRSVPSPLGEITYHELAHGPLALVLEATVPLLVVYVAYVGLRTVRLGDRKRAFPLLLAAGLTLGGLLHDVLVGEGVLANPYIAEYSWFAVMFLMSGSLSNEVFEAATTRQALREAQDRIAITLDSIQDAVITTDTEGRIAHLNPAAERLVETPFSEARGRPLSDLIRVKSTETDRPVRDPVQYALSRPADPFGKLPTLCTSTSEYLVDQGGAPLKQLDGRVVGAVVIYRDLTVQAQAIERLQRSEKMESIGQLAGGVAHDLNNLLTPIMSYSQLALERVKDRPREHDYLEHVLDAASKAANLTKKLLALSRKQVLDARTIPLNDCVRQAEPLFRRLVDENVTINLELDDDAGNVLVDAGQMEQVLLNLVANARDAMPGGGRIRIATHRETPRTTALNVSDTGSGVPPALKARLFEPFFTTKPRGKGTGLGLATARGIVEQHGGRIEVESEDGQGTSFSIQLPVALSGDVAPKSRKRPVPSVIGGNERILVVEDDAAVRELTQRALHELGYSVSTAGGADEARRASEHPVDLLVTDIVLPGASGMEIETMVAERWPEAKCLYMSGHADDLLGKRGFLDHGVQVLRKPFTVTTLALRVREVLDRDAANDERVASSR